MANELNNAFKVAAEKIVKYVDQMATLTVETRYVEVGEAAADFAASKPVACTVIRLDGDCTATLPMRRREAGTLEVDASLFEMHERNVAAAVDYRARMMDALLQTFKQRI